MCGVYGSQIDSSGVVLTSYSFVGSRERTLTARLALLGGKRLYLRNLLVGLVLEFLKQSL